MDLSELRKVSTDTAYYAIYPPRNSLCSEIISYLNHLVDLHTYLWHQDPVQLQTRSRPNTRTQFESVWIEGTTCVGECIDDEWYIVYLLRLATKKYPGCVVRVTDSDGEFLLIEAAQELPRWVTPENATNRVYIYDGDVHIVPLSHSTSCPPPDIEDEEEKKTYLSVEDGINLVRDPNCNTLASSEVQNVIKERISSYPGMIATSHLHYTVCYLPKDIAKALQADPQLISSAVSTFYERDPIQLRACQTMSRFSLEEKYFVRIKMTRPMYAQLQGQRFSSPKVFQKADWFKGVDDEKSAEWRRRDIGLKLACGFEMAWQQGKIENQKSTSSSYLRTFQTRVDQVLQDETTPHIPTISSDMDRDESTDDWLQIDPQFLESILSQKDRDAAPGFSNDEQAHAEKLGGLAEKLQRFVQSEGSLDGALFEDEMSENDSDEDGEQHEMTEADKRKRTEGLVEAVDLSKWGSKNQKKVETRKDDENERHVTNSIKQLRFDINENDYGEREDSDNASEQDVDGENDDDSDYMLEDDGIDMEKEAQEFLAFVRQELGVSEQEYNDILASKKDNEMGGSRVNALLGIKDTKNMDTEEVEPVGKRLDSFEALMNQMDIELKKEKQKRQQQHHPDKNPTSMSISSSEKRKGTVTPPEDIELNMDAELDRLLERDEDEDDAPADYTLIKSFLESYKSQAGGPGPASNLAGRLDPSFTWPQDDS